MKKLDLLAASLFLLLPSLAPTTPTCIPPSGCSVALANYIVSADDSVATIATAFQSSITSIQTYNKIPNVNNIFTNQVLSIPFPCACSNGQLAYSPQYSIKSGDTIDNLVRTTFSNLSHTSWVVSANGDTDANNLTPGSILSIPINCSCGDPDVSTTYGLFLTYVVQAGDAFTSLSQKFGIQAELLREYNGHVDFNNLVAYTDIIFVPAKGHYQSQSVSSFFVDSGEKVVEFSHEQLARSTNNFDESKIIGSGGFGKVYYAEMNSKKVAIKEMDIRESQQFKAEVQVLARVHHKNLVELVGWCTEKSLCLVYEFVENGTLRSHLEAPQKGAAPLTWASRVQIALDTARGLEYIHEYTVPSYIHRDIKPDNILLDNSLHAKVADFGLAKLGEITGTTKNAGTQGYLAPEYVMGGFLSPKVDVYAFGVVLMQLISAKRAIVFLDDDHRRSLPYLVYLSLIYKESLLECKIDVSIWKLQFEQFLKEPNSKEKLGDFVDPTLKEGVQDDDDMLNSVWKLALLACECTNDEADMRPDMKNIVIRISSLASSHEWAVGAFNLQAGGR